VIAQLAPAASVVPQPFVTIVKEPAFVPVMVIAEIVSATVPAFVRVVVWLLACVLAELVKVSALGEKAPAGVPVPVPESVTMRGAEGLFTS